MLTKLEILKKLFIRENIDPESLKVLNEYLSNPACTVIKYSGIISEHLGEQEIDDDLWTDPDGDYILERSFSPSLHTKEHENEIVSIGIDPAAEPKDVIRLINKISKDINDHYLERAYQMKKYLLNHPDALSKENQLKKEYEFNQINTDSSYREVMLVLLTTLEKYEESEWLTQKQIKENLLFRFRKEDVRIVRQLNASNSKCVNFRGLTEPINQRRYPDDLDDAPF